jgi:hypothetical protein
VIYTHSADTTASKREQLGEDGLAHLEKLEDVGYGHVYLQDSNNGRRRRT